MTAGKIPDPLKNPYEIYKRTLDKHHEIIKKTEHFLSLSAEKDADAEMLSDPNWSKILDLLPNRIRVESEILNTPATNLEEKCVQYGEFKQWITKKREEDPKERKIAKLTIT